MRSFGILLVVLLPALSTQIRAQNSLLNVGVGLQSTTSKDLIHLQNQILNENSNLDLKKTDSFPIVPTIYLGLKKLDSKGNFIGLYWRYSSTGGRVAISDYSATIISDQIVTTHEVGVFLENNIAASKVIQPFISISLSGLISQLTLRDLFSTPEGNNSTSEHTLISENLALSPGIGFTYKKIKYPVTVSLHYLIDVTEFPFHLKGERKVTLRLSDNREVNSGLSGLRLNLVLSINI